MKRTPFTQLFLASLMLAVSVCATRADLASFINTFNNSSSFLYTNTAGANYNPPPYTIRPDYTNSFNGIMASNVVWSTNNDTLYTPGSGSVRFDFIGISSYTNSVPITNSDGTTNLVVTNSSAAWTMDIFNSTTGSNGNVYAVAFDIMVDTNSAQDSSGGYGNFSVITRDASYTFPTNSSTFTNYNEELGNPNYSTSNNLAGTWEHILITGTNGLPDATHVTNGQTNDIRAITWQWYWTGHDLNGNVTCYIDNLVIYTNGTLSKPAMTISNYNGPKGVLDLISTPNPAVNTANYEEQNLQTKTVTNSWVTTSGVGGTGPTNTYALTITNYPPPAYSNFATFIWIACNNSGVVPTEANADWVENNNMYFHIVNNADGSATAQLLWKVGDPNDNSMYYGNNGYVTGFLASVTSPSPLGTWAMTFDHDTNITLTAPNGTTAVTNMPYSSAGYPLPTSLIPVGAKTFAKPVGVYIGVQAGLSNNIGQSATFSEFQIITNGVAQFSDNFGGNSLDTTKWVVTAEDPSGIAQIPANATYLLSWTLPDVGFVLTTSTNLADTNSWVGTTLVPFPNNGKRSAYAPGGNKAFYRLRYILNH